MTAVFEVLAEERRRAILDLLRQSECSVGELVGRLGTSQPTVSTHLRVLRAAGLVAVRTAAQRTGLQPVETPLRIGAHGHQPGLPQYPQVLGHRGLAGTEPADQLAHRALRLAEQVQDGPPPSLGQHLEHSRHIRKYAQSVIYLSRHTAERLPVSRPDVLG